MEFRKYNWMVLIFLIVNLKCASPIEDNLIGEWRLDSAYYFYNNFEYSRDGWHQEEIYEFTASGMVFTKAVNAAISNKYELKGKELIYLDDQGNPFNTYEILELTKNNMALKSDKSPLFKGPNQKRYEVRYFSKVTNANP